MEAQRPERRGGDVGSLANESQEAVLRDGLGESCSTANSDLFVSRGDEKESCFDEEFSEEFRRGVRLESTEHGGEEEEEFAFVCENPDGLIISAEDAFEDGQIRPFYPIFGRNILLDEDTSQPGSPSASSSTVRGFLLEERMRNPVASASLSSSSSDGGDPLEGLAEGTYCVWGKGKPVADTKAACRKSNSTGFSRLWRVKDLLLRSNSDGKDAFVFLNPKKLKENNTTTATTTSPTLEMKPAPKPSSSKAKASASGSASMVTTKEGRRSSHGYPARMIIDKNRRRSYLPYKVGFFTNINGMSRNVHPY
ncbi:hypothetical protein MLD38_002465 [Melastoma candidum]|uniref:Uncharacterized protein n=1 Tax=Melastoma candidum TaxID=119954 RepID=A0ACB9S007_9MYRT|nr:hypothetical protein MLD38_002465 [Melastoma candidum]